MMGQGWLRPVTLRRAFVASLCLHALLAALFPRLSTPRTRVAEPVETISFERIAPIRPERVDVPHAVPSAVAASASRPATVAKHAVRPSSPKAEPNNRAAAVRRLAVTSPNPPPAAPAAAATQTTATATPIAQPTPAPRDVANAEGTGDAGGLMPFGADLPVPVLNPRVAERLRRLHVRVTLLVTVGDDGRTKRVVFRPPVDPLVERRIVALLSDAAWDAAVCGGGIACVGQAVIKL